jgi:hypothetical protein
LPIAFCCLVIGMGDAAAQAARDCGVTGIEGQSARLGPDGTFGQIGLGPLPQGVTVVETGPGTRLEVTCEVGFVVTIGPDSRADLSDLIAPDRSQSIVMMLLDGIIGVVTPDRTEGTVEVRTPFAIAAVRSTAWLVEHDDAVATAVFAREGRVTVSNREIAVVLREGEGITLTRDTTVRPVAAWGQARIDQATSALGFGWD